jgi:hypothetical protein
MPAEERTHSERIASLREELRTILVEATSLIETAPDTSSEARFAFSERLQDACWNFASATHCLSVPHETFDLPAAPPVVMRHHGRSRKRRPAGGTTA